MAQLYSCCDSSGQERLLVATGLTVQLVQVKLRDRVVQDAGYGLGVTSMTEGWQGTGPWAW